MATVGGLGEHRDIVLGRGGAMEGRSRSTPLVVVALATFAIAGAASAGPPPSEFWFWADVLGVTDTHGVLDGTIHVGTNVVGRVRYDPATADDSVDPQIGSYAPAVPPGAFFVAVGAYNVTVPSVRLLVFDDFNFASVPPPFDSFDWRFEGATFALPGAAGVSLNSLVFRMDDASTTAFSSDALPQGPVDVADLPSTGFTIGGCLDTELNGFFCEPSQSLVISGEIVRVPEPSWTAAALAAGIVLARRRRAGLRP
jgi:hypothetical protein